jgi:hypothetical protein
MVADREERKVQAGTRGIVAYNPLSDPEARRFGIRAAFGPGNTQQQVVQTIAPGRSAQDEIRNRATYQTNQALAGVNFPNMTDIFASMYGGGSSGGKGITASDALAKRKYEDELAKERRTIQAYQNMLSGGGYRSGFDQLLAQIEAQGKTTSANVEDTYKRALGNIGAGYETAEGLTTKGYGALEEFLRANPNNPYANVQVSAGTAPDAMEQLLSAYGVSADPVRAQVAAEQAAAEQGAAGFQNLLSTLGGVAQQSDLSRLAEMEMARTLAGETLGTQRATYSSQAARARADALAQIEAQLAQARLEQEMAANARRQQIEDAIIAAGGSVPSVTKEPDKEPDKKPDKETQGETEEEKRRREMLAAMVANAAAGAGTGANMGPFAYAI